MSSEYALTTPGVIIYADVMPRWTPDARERLRTAALELFAERGFSATTVPDIVDRAGLTRRTFFRHFSDKREVFFGDDEVPAIATRLLAEAPADLPPMVIVQEGLRTLGERRFDPRRAEIRAARRVIDAEPALLERDLRKQADLRRAVRDGFVLRGADPVTAETIAAVTAEVFQTALLTWLDDTRDAPLAEHVDAAVDRMRTVLGVSRPRSASSTPRTDRPASAP